MEANNFGYIYLINIHINKKRKEGGEFFMLKGQKGITLVALIVTIVVLIILAGVTLTIALSDNGIFQKSKNAVDDYDTAAEEEKIELNTTDQELQNAIDEYGPQGE